MKIYIVEMWDYGCDWAGRVAADMRNVAIDHITAAGHFNDYDNWQVGVIAEYDAISGKWSESKYFENTSNGAVQVDFDEIYTTYR